MKYLLSRFSDWVRSMSMPPLERRTYVGYYLKGDEVRGFIWVAWNPDEVAHKVGRIKSCRDVGPAPWRWASMGRSYRLAYLNSVKEKHGIKSEL